MSAASKRKSKKQIAAEIAAAAAQQTPTAEENAAVSDLVAQATEAFGPEKPDVHQVEDLDAVEAVALQDQKERIALIGFQSDLFATPEERKRARRLAKLDHELSKATRERNKAHEKLRRAFRRYDRLVTEVKSLERRYQAVAGDVK